MVSAGISPFTSNKAAASKGWFDRDRDHPPQRPGGGRPDHEGAPPEARHQAVLRAREPRRGSQGPRGLQLSNSKATTARCSNNSPGNSNRASSPFPACLPCAKTRSPPPANWDGDRPRPRDGQRREPRGDRRLIGYALRGTSLPRFNYEGREIPVRIRFQESDRDSLAALGVSGSHPERRIRSRSRR
jgi:hypothetical protein